MEGIVAIEGWILATTFSVTGKFETSQSNNNYDLNYFDNSNEKRFQKIIHEIQKQIIL